MLGQDFWLQRTVAVLSDGFLRGVGVEVLQIRLGVGRQLLVLEIRVYPGNRWFGEDADRRINDLEFVFVLRNFPQGFVLPGQVDVADFLDGKRGGGAARSAVSDLRVA